MFYVDNFFLVIGNINLNQNSKLSAFRVAVQSQVRMLKLITFVVFITSLLAKHFLGI